MGRGREKDGQLCCPSVTLSPNTEMKCPYCSHPDTRVFNSREADSGSIVRRRRECIGCGKRFTTYERAAVLDLLVIKKDERRESYDRQKLKNGIMKACEKRPVSQIEIDNIVGKIEQELISLDEPEIKSSAIGELVMQELKNLDEVAYIRFASVYREFRDITDFKRELAVLAGDAEKTNN